MFVRRIHPFFHRMSVKILQVNMATASNRHYHTTLDAPFGYGSGDCSLLILSTMLSHLAVAQTECKVGLRSPCRKLTLLTFHTLLTAFCLCLLFTALCSSPVRAATRATHTGDKTFVAHIADATDPITIISETYTLTYPKGIDFQINVRDAQANITGATIFLLVPTPRYLNEVHPVPIDHPATTQTLTWHENTSGQTFLSPGTHVTYYWHFQDSVSNYDEAAQHFDVTDTRFTWQHLTQNLLQVNWYNRPTDFGQTVLTQALTSISRISNNLGAGLSHPVNLWVYQNDNDFRGALPPSAHEWVGGIAFIDLNQALIVAKDAEDTTMIRDMPHELTHLVFHQLIAQGISAPIWFDEGLAVYNQLYQEPDMTIRFKQALAAHDLLPFNTLYTEFPVDADQAYLAYAQSWNMVGYMYKTFGRNKMQSLIHSLDSSQSSFSDDVQKNLGEDPLHLENDWRVSLGQPGILLPASPTLTPQISTQPHVQVPIDSNAPLYLIAGGSLVLLPIGGIIAFFIYQRRKHRGAIAAQAEPIMSATFTPQGMPMRPPTYTHPTQHYEQHVHPSMYTQHPPYGSYSQGENFGAGARQGYQSPQGPQMPFIPGQEYLGQQPPKQAPQE